ncbi:MAG: substrate-binding domain-containing protein [Desulfobacteraceae bacterium]|jgi:ABC-type phosphate transport system substrate-binding protein
MKFKMIVFILAISIIPAMCLGNDLIVIANSSVSDTTLSKNDLTKIYLGKKSSWSNGGKIKFVVLGGATHAAFLENYVGKTESQFNTFWKKQVFTGKGSPPEKLNSDQAMVDYVAQTAGAIGYVSAGTNVSKVKTITIK